MTNTWKSYDGLSLWTERLGMTASSGDLGPFGCGYTPDSNGNFYRWTETCDLHESQQLREAPFGQQTDGDDPEPHVPLGTDDHFKERLKPAFQEAIGKLRDPGCGNFFGGSTYAMGVMDATLYRFVDLPENPNATAAAPSFHHVLIVPSSAFMTYDARPGQPRPLDRNWNSGADFGALVLLHELGHQVGRFGEDTGIEINRRHSRDVIWNCHF
jgi:hypothetical protein